MTNCITPRDYGDKYNSRTMSKVLSINRTSIREWWMELTKLQGRGPATPIARNFNNLHQVESIEWNQLLEAIHSDLQMLSILLVKRLISWLKEL